MSTFEPVPPGPTDQVKTVGLSPKAVLAFLFPAIAAVVASAADWVVSGQFEVTTIRTALAGLLASGLALLGAYVGRPGTVAPDLTVTPKVKLAGEKGQLSLDLLVRVLIYVVIIVVVLVVLFALLDRI